VVLVERVCLKHATMSNDVWVAIDVTTNRIVGFGSQSDAQTAANTHNTLSGNKTKVRTLKVGMIIYE